MKVEDKMIRHPPEMSQNMPLTLHNQEVLKLWVAIQFLVGHDKYLKYNLRENRKISMCY